MNTVLKEIIKFKNAKKECLGSIGRSSNSEHALVVFSGGQDSTTCLALAAQAHEKVTAINFQYGQRHALESEAAENICGLLGIRLIKVDVSFMRELVTSGLLDEGDIGQNHPLKKNLPYSFVPGRNALFLTVAHAVAQEAGAGFIYTGVCQTDYSGYPDCRQEFITRLESALNCGYESEINIVTPLMYLDKAQTWELAADLGFLDLIVEQTLTCYEGDIQQHAWGRGCGECPACKLRMKGFSEYKNSIA